MSVASYRICIHGEPEYAGCDACEKLYGEWRASFPVHANDGKIIGRGTFDGTEFVAKIDDPDMMEIFKRDLSAGFSLGYKPKESK